MNRKKNIWILNNSAGSVKHGMVYRNYYMAKSLNMLGYNCYIISSTYNHQFINFPETKNILNYENINGVNYCFIKTCSYNGNGIGRVMSFFVYCFNLIRSKRKLKFLKPDFIVASSPMPLLGILGKYFANYYNSKFIFEVRDLWPETLIEIGGMSRFHPFVLLLAFAEKYSLKTADAVVAVMPHADRYFQQIVDVKDKYYWIPNGIFIDEMVKNEKRSVTLPIVKKNGFKYVCYAGAIGKANRLSILIEAAKLLSEEQIEFIIIGNGPEKTMLEEMSAKLPKVHFVGSIPKNDILSIIKQFDICFVGAQDQNIYKYGISFTKLYDYLFARKPVVFAVNSSNNIIEKSGCGISVSPNSPESIANSIIDLTTKTEEELFKIGEQGYQYVCEYHSWDKLSISYSNIFIGITKN